MNSFVRKVVAVLFATMAGGLSAAESRRPNIVLIMSDDMGFSDLGCYGSEIRTPNLDRLAAEGLRFTQFYNNARCCPTRASLMTGLYPHQAGVGHMSDDYEVPGYHGHITENCVTIAEVLRGAGYRTMMSGKWHIGDIPNRPVERGFEESFFGVWGAWNYFRWSADLFFHNDQRFPAQKEDKYLTDVITDNAIDFIEKGDRAKPFFIYVAYSAAHWPLHALPEDITRYQGKYTEGWEALRHKRYQRMIELGLIKPEWKMDGPAASAPDWDSLPAPRKKMLDRKMAVYAAQIDRMDQGIGRIVSKLHDLAIEDNTVVLFLQDNGGCAERIDQGKPGVPAGQADSFLSYGLPWAHASDTPFRMYKHWVHEGGISTPLIVHWPAVIREGGKLTSQPGHLIDIMATCVDLAGGTYPKEFKGHAITPLEGKSLVPIFRSGSREGHDAIYWEHEGNRAVRQGKWKLVSQNEEPWELYDLDADRTEQNNLVSSNTDKVAVMSAMWDVWAKRVGVVRYDELVKMKFKPPKQQVEEWQRGQKKTSASRASN